LRPSRKAGVTVSVEGGGTGRTDGNGAYRGCGLAPGPYKVTASLEGSSIAPPFLKVIPGPDATGQNFTVIPGGACVTGLVTGPQGPGNPAPGVSLTLNDGRVAATGSDGAYSFCGLPPGSYTVAPGSAKYEFSPASTPAELGATNAEAINFTATPIGQPFCVSGQLIESSGPTVPIGGIPIRIDGTVQTTTGADGRYSKCGLSEGSHTVVPDHPG
jgi:hypothetical protein